VFRLPPKITRLVAPVLLVVLGGLLPGTALAGDVPSVVNTAPPTISGTPTYRATLVASPGTWTPDSPAYEYQWLRNGIAIQGADAATYRPVLGDLNTRLAVQVTASAAAYDDATATSVETAVVRRAALTVRERPRINGVRRYLRTLTASTGEWAQGGLAYSFRWLRDGDPIARATRQRYRLGHLDVGHRISVRVLAEKPGYLPRRVTSYATSRIGHRVPLRRTVHYSIETRGRITADLAAFRRLANASLNDPRGWRTTGTAFKEVASGGSMTLVLAEASQVPGFSSGCDVEWSCRVGRYVVINQTRWQNASPAWRSHGGSLRDYRHLVISHETGHWLGHGHASCPSTGARAFVMQQQSKALGGCRINPFPRPAEWTTPRF